MGNSTNQESKRPVTKVVTGWGPFTEKKGHYFYTTKLENLAKELAEHVMAAIRPNIEALIEEKLEERRGGTTVSGSVSTTGPDGVQEPTPTDTDDAAKVVMEVAGRPHSITVHPDHSFSLGARKERMQIGDAEIYSFLDLKQIETIAKALGLMKQDERLDGSTEMIHRGSNGRKVTMAVGSTVPTDGLTVYLRPVQTEAKAKPARTEPSPYEKQPDRPQDGLGKTVTIAIRGVEGFIKKSFLPGDHHYKFLTRSVVAGWAERDAKDTLMHLWLVPAEGETDVGPIKAGDERELEYADGDHFELRYTDLGGGGTDVPLTYHSSEKNPEDEQKIINIPPL